MEPPMLGSDLCDYSDVYIVVKGTITDDSTNANNKTDKMLAFKNDALFTLCTSKINNTFTDRRCSRCWYCYANE